MKSAIEVTKRHLFSDSHRRYEVSNIPIEDCRFLNFTEFLDDIDEFKNPVPSRNSGKFKNGSWSLLGYGCRDIREQIEDFDSEEDVNQTIKINWEYVIFNGLLDDALEVKNLSKLDVDKKINETIRFLEKTFSNDLINDFDESRELQNQLLEHYHNDSLDRVDICIISDSIINTEKLPSKFTLKSIDLECRIYYWDIKRWDAIKRNKSKREPIDIDFQSDDFEIYEVPYLHQKTGRDLDYYLSIFPGDLLADLYDFYNTRLLENNVRVFLSATRKANKGIRDTIGFNDGINAYKFFSYNNGISATAENIEVSNGRITKIKDFQIVNGGQTTASIHYSRKKDRKPLENVFVSVKITALKKDDSYSGIVSKISKAANTQSSIAESDFYANDKELVLLEQIALKNPSQDDDDLNIYFFFERMKGQYKVLETSQGGGKKSNLWSNKYPRALSFNKLDLARWSNMMNFLPHHASEGAEKQFKSFMENKNFKRTEYHDKNYKTIIGFGLVFKRIKRLCGTATGKIYPSRIIDLVTKQHVPVAMSTAIYTASYLHLLTDGKLDYWAFFDYKYGLCKSVNTPVENKERVSSEIDDILEGLIDACWTQIAIFGGAAAQEKSKKVECWEFVKKNIKISDSLKMRISRYKISDKEFKKREKKDSNDEVKNYFDSLNILLSNGGNNLSEVLNISSINSDYRSEKTTIGNLINRVKDGEKILSTKRVLEVKNLYDKLSNDGFKFKMQNEDICKFEINYTRIFEDVFKNKESFFEKFYSFLCEDEVNLENYETAYDKLQSITEKYNREYGLTLNEIKFVNDLLEEDLV